jgi:protein translocase SecG subunit
MKDAILIVQIVISIALAASILLQVQGSGLGSSFGESGEQYRSKRGVEKLLFRTTVVLAALFGITSLVNLLMR